MLFTCSRVNLFCVPTCSRAITSNKKNKFSMTFSLDCCYLPLSFSYEIKVIKNSNTGVILWTLRNRARCLRPVTILKKRLQRRCFSVNFAECLGIPFLQDTWGQLLLVLGSKFDFPSKSCSFLCKLFRKRSSVVRNTQK